jgi:creatinine amidohydrolase
MTFYALGELSWPDVAALCRDRRAIGFVPLGAIEQHGPHLPLSTDTLIADALAQAIAERVAEPLLVTPVVTGGLSSHHTGFPGTMTLDEAAFEGAIVAFLEAFERAGVHDVALVSAHGGNFAFIGELAERLRSDTLNVVAYSDLVGFLEHMREAALTRLGVETPETDVHAGALETSLALHLFPELVHDGWEQVDGLTEPFDGFLDLILTEGVHTVSPTGVLGDPKRASAELGTIVLDALADLLTEWLVRELSLTSLGSASR